MTLRELRESHALTQTDLASACAVSVTTISAWERGTATPRLPHVRELARVLKVTIAEINQAIKETGDKEK